MLFKIGDQVTVRSDLAYERDFDGYGNIRYRDCDEFGVPNMRNRGLLIDSVGCMIGFGGRTVTIAEKLPSYLSTPCYRIDEDEGLYFWTDEMFEESRVVVYEAPPSEIIDFVCE